MDGRTSNLLERHINNTLYGNEISGRSGRLQELRQIVNSLTNKEDDFIFACIERIVILNKNLPPSNRIVTDIDGVILRLKDNKMVLELHEAKDFDRRARNQSEAKKDITLTKRKDYFWISCTKIGDGRKISYRI